MIHHAPPRLTAAQAMYCRQCRVVDTSSRIGLYLTKDDREWARTLRPYAPLATEEPKQ